MSKRNKALAMAVRRALLLIADAIKLWCDDVDEQPASQPNGKTAKMPA